MARRREPRQQLQQHDAEGEHVRGVGVHAVADVVGVGVAGAAAVGAQRRRGGQRQAQAQDADVGDAGRAICPKQDVACKPREERKGV